MGLFSSLKRSRGLDSAAVVVLGGVQISLTLLEKLMDGMPIPFVKGAAGAAIEVIKIARGIHSSKTDCDNLVQRSTSLLVVILNSFRGKTEGDIPGYLKQEVERLTMSLLDVLAELETIHRRSKRVLIGATYYIDNTERLKDCSSKLDWAMQAFQVTSKVDSCLQELERHEEVLRGHATILDAVDKVHKAMEGASIDLPSSVMPVDPTIFGRQEYVDDAVGLILSKKTTRLAILGPGGIGKTSVALKVVHHTSVKNKFSRNCHWVACEQATSLPLLIELVAKSLGLHTSPSNDRFYDVITTLESSELPHLFLLDNFETPWDIEGQQSHVANFLARFGSISTVSFILTMRGHQHPASDQVEWSLPRLASLDRLTLDAAREAFIRIAPNTSSDPKLDSLISELDCMPLAITLMAKLAEAGESPSDLLSQRKSEPTGLFGHAGGDRRNSINVSIKLSLQSTSMRHRPEAIPLLSILAKLPAGISLDLFPDLCSSIPDWKQGLRTLRAVALVYSGTDNSSVHVLSPIRSFVIKHHPLGSNALADIQNTFYKLAEKGKQLHVHSEFLENAKELAKVESNMEAVLLDALQNGDGVKEADLEASVNYSTYLCWTQPRENIAVIAVTAARTFHPHWLARCLKMHGDILLTKAQYNAAESVLQEARSEFVTLGDYLQAARCLQSLGNILLMKNQYDAAEATLQSARTESLTLGDQLHGAQCLRLLGNMLLMKNEYNAAELALKEARNEFIAINDYLGAAQCLRLLGNTLQMKNQHNAAESTLQEAKSELTAIGDRLGVARCQLSLSNILQIRGQYDAAESSLKETRSEFLIIGDCLGATQCLQLLGIILQMNNQHDEAQLVLKDARSGFMVIGDCLGAAQCLLSLGNIMQMKNRYDEACSTLQEAKSEFVAIDDSLGTAQCLQLLGEIFRVKGQYAAAESAFQDARTNFVTIGDVSNAAQCLQSIGDILEMKNRHDVAESV